MGSKGHWPYVKGFENKGRQSEPEAEAEGGWETDHADGDRHEGPAGAAVTVGREEDGAQTGRQGAEGSREAADVWAETAEAEGEAQGQVGFCVSGMVVSMGISRELLAGCLV